MEIIHHLEVIHHIFGALVGLWLVYMLHERKFSLKYGILILIIVSSVGVTLIRAFEKRYPEYLLPVGCAAFCTFLIYLFETIFSELLFQTSEELGNFPPGIIFPNPLKDKIRYYAKRKLLIFKGSMSKEERDTLLNLSTNASYRETIEALYERSPKPTPTGQLYYLVFIVVFWIFSFEISHLLS